MGLRGQTECRRDEGRESQGSGGQEKCCEEARLSGGRTHAQQGQDSKAESPAVSPVIPLWASDPHLQVVAIPLSGTTVGTYNPGWHRRGVQMVGPLLIRGREPRESWKQRDLSSDPVLSTLAVPAHISASLICETG